MTLLPVPDETDDYLFPSLTVLHLGWQHEHGPGNELYEYLHEHVRHEHRCQHDGQLHEHVIRQHGHEPLHDRHVTRHRSHERHGRRHDGHERSPEPQYESHDRAARIHERPDILHQHERHEPHIRTVEHQQVQRP